MILLNVTDLCTTACPTGTYRSMTDDHNLQMCLSCPMNTVTVAIGAAVCECVDGYFRDDQTNEDIDCTRMSLSPKYSPEVYVYV